MIKVAAYCRVSTDREDQVNSFEGQQRYFREYIEKNEEYILYRIYADEGLTGTNTKHRKAFQQMINDAKLGRFKLILTKEISRFARNTLDSIYYTRQLKQVGVGVYFVNDNIYTLDPDAELRLTILASIAQEESRRTSQRVKWGQKRRMEQGVVFGTDLLGYDVIQGKLYRNEEGARVVKKIFYKFLQEGKGTYVIARELLEEGIAPRYANKWSSSVVLRILKNEKYCGDLVQKKTYTPDYLTHQKRYNDGTEELVRIEKHHEAIIDRETFNAVQRILEERASKSKINERYHEQYCYSGKIHCGYCGKCYVARKRKKVDGTLYLVWRCYHKSRNEHEGRSYISEYINKSQIQQLQDSAMWQDNNKIKDSNKIQNNDMIQYLNLKNCCSGEIHDDEVDEIITQVINKIPIAYSVIQKQVIDIVDKMLGYKEMCGWDMIDKECEYKESNRYRTNGSRGSNRKLPKEKCSDIDQERQRLLLAYIKQYINEEEYAMACQQLNMQNRDMGNIDYKLQSDTQSNCNTKGCIPSNIKINIEDKEKRLQSIIDNLDEIIRTNNYNQYLHKLIAEQIIRVDRNTWYIIIKGSPIHYFVRKR